MTTESAIKILDAHSMNHRTVNGVLQVETNLTFGGELFSSWEICPNTKKELYEWLGY